ncbi:MAG: hypothetical protein P1V36_07985 [Planctomycetota bacterium]|nr:hypothetical protein [Planctomycetota bacterium]
MVRPTPGTEASAAERKTIEEAAALEAKRAKALVGDECERAVEFLEMLGKSDHPDAERDPVYALYQVAIDFQCSAHGYRELYLRKRARKEDDDA